MRACLSIDHDSEPSIYHPLQVERHWGLHHSAHHRVLHDPRVDRVAVRFRFENDPRKNRDLTALALGRARERASHGGLEIIAGALAILQGAMASPESAGATGDAPIL